MSAPILVTKLFIPPARAGLVQRPDLIERLNEGLHRKLTLLSAPAGFGKTTLLSHWVESLGGEGQSASQTMRIAWLSLDADDSDPVRFLTYLIAALDQVKGIEADLGQGALSMLQSAQPAALDNILISLINDLAAVPDKIILILDDYHLIEAQAVDQALTFLLEHLPPQLHLVIATRQDPPLSLGRLRARDQVTEIRAADLRFTAAQAADFLNRVMGLDLSAQDIAELETRTEGWVAGLQLAAISMQGRQDLTGFIKTFTGGHRLVLDFLIEEVLSQQPQNIQNFLLQTAILDRMTGPLCDALTGQDNGQQTLEALDRANLFIVPLDEERCWYRYHHLFVDLLRQRLRQKQAGRLSELHGKASEWYRRNGLIDQAVEHALRGKHFERASHLIGTQKDELWQRGEHVKLRRWLSALPEEYLLSEPQIGLVHAYYLHTIGEYELGERFLQSVEHEFAFQSKGEESGSAPDHGRLADIDRPALQGRLATIRALIYSFSGDVKRIIQYADRALEYLPEQDLTWRNLAAFALGDAHSYLGDMAASYEARDTAFKACEAVNNVYYTIIAALKLASTLREQGELQRTVELCRAQIRLADKNSLSETNFIGCIRALLGEMLAELNDLDGATGQAEQGVRISERGQNLVVLAMSYLYLMRVLFSKGDLAGAEEVIEKVSHLEREITVPAWFSDQMGAWQAKLFLAQDDLEAASNWANERGIMFDDVGALEDIDYFLLIELIVFARVLLAQGRFVEASGLLERLHQAAEAGGRIGRVIEIRMLQALTLESGGDMDGAMESLAQAIRLAEPRGFFRIFVDEGPPMARLLYEALQRGMAPEYIQRLLAAFPAVEVEDPAAVKAAEDPSGLIEPLSERELEVLQLIAEGLTNPEIAARLYLSLHTVKAHARNIYGKLDVHNRTQAIARMRALGLLPRR